MVDFSFIRLKPTLEEAHDLQEAPRITYTYLGQIQLKPRDPKPYFQITNSAISINIGSNPQVYIVDCKGNEQNITSHFAFESIDVNGITQIAFRLAYLPTDYYHNLVYLKIVGTNTYYSNKFQITDENSYLTSRIDYIDTRELTFTDPIFQDFFKSIRLNFEFDSHIDQEESEVYRQLSTGQNVNTRFEISDLKVWLFDMADSFTWKRLKRAFYTGKCYIDFTRNYTTDPFEYQRRIEDSNVSSNTFTTDPDENDTITVEDVIIVFDGWTFDTADTYDSAHTIFND